MTGVSITITPFERSLLRVASALERTVSRSARRRVERRLVPSTLTAHADDRAFATASGGLGLLPR
ncbi:hypothetical protein ACFQZV_08925 [Microbacterium koreense]|uniref:Uncharacterized protein n=1 Tax=Microbacterium koreense TaxID=323761 RepID=A0ABW2ZSD3_9MICO